MTKTADNNRHIKGHSANIANRYKLKMKKLKKKIKRLYSILLYSIWILEPDTLGLQPSSIVYYLNNLGQVT